MITTLTARAADLVSSKKLDGHVVLPRLECMMSGLGREIGDRQCLCDLAAERQGEQSNGRQELHDESEMRSTAKMVMRLITGTRSDGSG